MSDDNQRPMAWSSMLGMAGMFIFTIALGIFIQPAWNFEEAKAFGEEGSTESANILFYLIACGGKCPDGFVANDAEQSCECPSGTELSSDQSTCETKEEIDTGVNIDTDDTGEDTETGDTGDDTPVDPWDELERINGKIIIPTLFEGRVIPRSDVI